MKDIATRDGFKNAVNIALPVRIVLSLLTVVRMLLNSVRIINTRQVSAVKLSFPDQSETLSTFIMSTDLHWRAFICQELVWPVIRDQEPGENSREKEDCS